jgi:hypothetical protein
MPTTIKLKNSVTTTNVPSSLAQGEVAINVTDKKVWVGNAATTPVQLLGTGSDGSFTNLTVSGTTALNGGTTLGDASGDALTINSSAVSIPNGLNFDSNTFVIDATNNRVGVGTASPSSALDVNGVATFSAGTVSAPAITTTGDTNTGIFFPAADTIAFTEGGTEVIRINSSGNVGIGTSSPTRKLDVTDSSSANTIPLAVSNLIGGLDIASAGINFNAHNVNFARIVGGQQADSSFADGNLIFLTRNAETVAERMRISNSGNVGIGTSSPAFSLDIAGTMRGRGDAYLGFVNGSQAGVWWSQSNYSVPAFQGLTSAGNVNDIVMQPGGGSLLVGTATNGGVGVSIGGSTIRTNVSTTAYANHHIITNPNGDVGVIYTTGSTTVFANLSDYRLKQNIQPMTGALAKVAALKPCTYKWKVDGSDGQGFIAHELQEVCPDAVVREKDAVDQDGNPQYQGIDTSFLVATLTAAIQELKAIVDAQATRIESLENK